MLAEQQERQKLNTFQTDLESVRLLAHPGSNFDAAGSTMTEPLHFGAAPLHNVIRQICSANKELATASSPYIEVHHAVMQFQIIASAVLTRIGI